MPIDYTLLAIKKVNPSYEVRETRRRAIEKDERAKKASARARDTKALPCRGCRWPREDHDTKDQKCEGPLEMAHRVAKGMGGDNTGERTKVGDLLQVCQHIHTRSKDGIERHGRTWIGSANGPVTFIRRGHIVGVEKRIGELHRAKTG